MDGRTCMLCPRAAAKTAQMSNILSLFCFHRVILNKKLPVTCTCGPFYPRGRLL